MRIFFNDKRKIPYFFSILLHLFRQWVLFWNLFWKTIIQEKDHKLLICRLTFYLCFFKLLNVYNNVQSLIKFKKIFGHSDESIHWHSESWINSDFFFCWLVYTLITIWLVCYCLILLNYKLILNSLFSFYWQVILIDIDLYHFWPAVFRQGRLGHVTLSSWLVKI